MSVVNKELKRFMLRSVTPSAYYELLERAYCALILSRIWRRRGIFIGHNVTWLGVPILTTVPGTRIEVGDGCLLCSRSSRTAMGVNHPIIIRTLKEGARVLIAPGVRMSGTTICSAQEVRIGKDTVLGANVVIMDTDFHSRDPVVRMSDRDLQDAPAAPVEIGACVFIGAGSYILKGVKVGAGAVIGAASVVTRDIPAEAIAAGNPARILR